MTNVDLLLTFCLQLAVILAACRLVGLVGRRLGQAQAVCDMITGVLLGPSLVGLLAPTVERWLFPATAVVTTAAAGAAEGGGTSGATVEVVIRHPSMAILYVLAQVGIGLYMFLVGLEFDLNLLRPQIRCVGLVSLTGIVAPFVLGAVAASMLLGRTSAVGAGLPPLFGAAASPLVAVLFLGLSLSITAFPILARILQEHGVATTLLGTLTIGAAAVDDATAWCLLAVLLAIASGSVQTALLTVGGAALYVLVMVTLGRGGLRWLARRAEQRPTPHLREQRLSLHQQSRPHDHHQSAPDRDVSDHRSDHLGLPLPLPQLSAVLCVVLVCSWFTTLIGIHQIFGAFIAGAVMPRGRFAQALRDRLEPVTLALFLPIFFVYSGLNTQLGLLNSPQVWLVAGLITALAILGKGAACTLAARASGQSWRRAATVGALMNSRGLIELVLLNIGLEQRLITPTLFTMLVLMAIVTTALTTPLFRMLYPRPALPVAAEQGLLASSM